MRKLSFRIIPFFLALLLLLMSVPVKPAEAAVVPLISSSANEVVIGSNLITAVKVTTPESLGNNLLVNIEIYSESGQRQFQKYFENQSLNSGGNKTYSISWKPGSTGKYRMAVGIFSAGWSRLLDWQNQVATIQVKQPTVSTVTVASEMQVWWPKNDVNISGTQPFKFSVTGLNLSDYNAYWQVDNGVKNTMVDSNTSEGPHKESLVDVTNWNWKGNGPYVLTFTAQKKSNGELIKKSINIYTVNTVASVTTPNPVVVASDPEPAVTNPIPNTPQTGIDPVSTVVTNVSGLYVNPLSPALDQATKWQSTRPADADLMLKIGNQPSARWFGGWNADIYTDVKTYVDVAVAANAIPELVLYNIPQRDCGGYSAGGVGSPDAYRAWIDKVANAIGNRQAIIILEPDALTLNDCLSVNDKQVRYDLLKYAVNAFDASSKVYIDAGHPDWVGSDETSKRLTMAGVSQADGFSLNVSNFYTTDSNIKFGTEVSQKLGGTHFVIDTSRNGLGSNGQWCNPSDRALGNKPTLATGNSLVDGFLWLKTPGESDGSCNGGPVAGQWWSEYALGLAQRANW
ncbi:MAG: glycoside hydrolase family 6 protein [Candidatus Magasanikiibacteriota bacterium]